MSLTLPDTALPQQSPSGPWSPDSLADALQREGKLLRDLVEVLTRQRGAVSRDDLAVVDETVYSAQRIFRTLAEARRRRHALLEILGTDGDTPLEELEGALGHRITEGVREARDDLRDAARRLSRELDLNRRILNGAIASGDVLIREIRGGGEKATGVYGPKALPGSPEGGAGLIINRQI